MIQNQESDSAEKLLIEDEVDLASMSAEALRTEIFTVEIAYNAEQALWFAENCQFDLVIFDIILPLDDGWTVLEKLREAESSAIVLMLTALDDVDNKVRGFNPGADDCWRARTGHWSRNNPYQLIC